VLALKNASFLLELQHHTTTTTALFVSTTHPNPSQRNQTNNQKFLNGTLAQDVSKDMACMAIMAIWLGVRAVTADV